MRRPGYGLLDIGNRQLIQIVEQLVAVLGEDRGSIGSCDQHPELAVLTAVETFLDRGECSRSRSAASSGSLPAPSRSSDVRQNWICR